MRWQDQSEKITLPPVNTFLATLSAADRARIAHPGHPLAQVAITSDCLQMITQHISTSRSELGGLLVGQAYGDDGDTPQLVVANRSVESRTFDSTGVSLRMETEVWQLARPLLGDNARIVGWYHSHPDLGAFFSDTDRTTQRNFFRQPYCVGLVIDPVREQLKAYLGPDCLEIPSENIVITQ